MALSALQASPISSRERISTSATARLLPAISWMKFRICRGATMIDLAMNAERISPKAMPATPKDTTVTLLRATVVSCSSFTFISPSVR